MNADASSAWRETEQWLSHSIEAAEKVLTPLLDLPATLLRTEIANRPELRSAGIVHCLVTAAHDCLERFPRHAYELTSIAVQQASLTDVPRTHTFVARRLHARAWLEHAHRRLDEPPRGP